MPDSLVGVMADLLDVSNGRIEGAVVVRVESFDRSEQTASVAPQVKRGDATPAVVDSVPVIFPGVYWDVQAGEYGVLLTGGLNWRRWWRTGEVSAPEDTTRHGLTNGLLLMSLTPQSDPRALPSKAMVVPKPTATGAVLLGSSTADKDVVHEDAITDILTWASAVSAAITLLGGDVSGALGTLTTDLPLAKAKNIKVDS